MPFGQGPSKGTKRKRKRLKDIQSFEVAIVPRGANRSQFVVLKEDGSMKLDPNKLAEAHATLGRVVTVCKSGTPAAETVDTLNKDLQNITNTLAGMLSTDGKTVDPVGLKARIAEITGIADGLANSTHDLNIQDQLDALTDKIQDLSKQVDDLPDHTPAVDTIPAATTDAAAATAAAASSTGDAATGDAAAAAATTGDADADAAAADADGNATAATGDGAAADSGAADADAGAAAASDAAASTGDNASGDANDSGETTDVVTKADLADFGKTIVDGFKEAMGSLSTTLKADTGRPQLLSPAGQPVEGGNGAQNSDPEAHDEKHWGNSFDLNDE